MSLEILKNKTEGDLCICPKAKICDQKIHPNTKTGCPHAKPHPYIGRSGCSSYNCRGHDGAACIFI